MIAFIYIKSPVGSVSREDSNVSSVGHVSPLSSYYFFSSPSPVLGNQVTKASPQTMILGARHGQVTWPFSQGWRECEPL